MAEYTSNEPADAAGLIIGEGVHNERQPLIGTHRNNDRSYAQHCHAQYLMTQQEGRRRRLLVMIIGTLTFLGGFVLAEVMLSWNSHGGGDGDADESSGILWPVGTTKGRTGPKTWGHKVREFLDEHAALPLAERKKMVVWEDCDCFSDKSEQEKWDLSQFLVPAASCATLQLPLSWNSEKSHKRTIEMFVKKVHASTLKSQGQLWLIGGGPGHSGAAMENLLPQVVLAMPGYDIMIPDHRGTGRSTPVTCPETMEHMDSPIMDFQKEKDVQCYNEITKTFEAGYLHNFNTAFAAFDLVAAINFTSPDYATDSSPLPSNADRASAPPPLPSNEVLMYGLSYGTYWVQRYLFVTPWKQVRSVTLDGIAPPDVYTIADKVDTSVNLVGSAFLNTCSQHPRCLAALGPLPAEQAAFLKDLVVSKRSECARVFGLSAEGLRVMLGKLVTDEYYRIVVPPLVQKLMRCSDRDQVELKRAFAWFDRSVGRLAFWGVGAGPVDERVTTANSTLNYNPITHTNLVVSEMYALEHPAPDAEVIAAMSDNLLFSLDYSAGYSNSYESWIRYNRKRSPGYGRYPATKGIRPTMLLLSGTLDAFTGNTWARYAATHYKHNTSTTAFVSVANVASGVVPHSQTTGDHGLTCGMEMMASFFTQGSPDLRCLRELQPVDFGCTTLASRRISEEMFGTVDWWDPEAHNEL
ncbi:hypothetical protein SARC_05071 [Sphaeroforma arctica JP610]|uniref:AB hydrolase-1 domain-containing protein n=1 Tax=Sphaeroforma arctica JP610 TaxID=667725 RepID=A0A0L0G0R5_9EUKA|nr:hypothetical protein SARC_05071 [Sphaeroforma arctica JP610]KNC82650.1 hypothetical protein SARC_05071 [Sphaeroforma arctica JP610]|eukprot:XP_014156552.1 hypothetical protein SARC_05071 [Sphaeroforma arctica JP610]